MKRALLILAILVVLAAPAMAQEKINYTTPQTASALIATGYADLYGIIVTTDGTNAITLTVYDNTSAATPQVTPAFVVAATPRTQYINFTNPIVCKTGIYVSASSSGSISYQVYLRR